MACPYFVPRDAWPSGTPDAWSGPRRVPLGEPYRGACSLTEIEIGLVEQATVCNFGYARQRCAHFPQGATIDAIRFSIPAVGELIWIAEQDHAPVAHGAGIPAAYAALARAFVRSYDTGKSPQGLSG